MVLSAIALTLSCVPVATAAYTTGSYTTDVTVSQPTDLTPSTGVALAYPSQPVKLGWGRVAGTSKYELQVATASSSSADCTLSTAFASDAIIVDVQVSDTAWVPTMRDSASKKIWVGTYCWRVRSVGAPFGTWSTGSKFSRTWTSTPTNLKFFNDEDGVDADTMPDIPRSSTSDPSDASTKVTGYLRWDAVEGAVGYDVQVSPSRSFAESAIALSLDNVKGNAVALLHLPDNTYYWRVRAVAPNGTEGSWATASSPSFTVAWRDSTWNDAGNVTPAYNGTESEVLIGWTPMRGAAYYEFQASTRAGCFWEAESQVQSYWGDWVNDPPYTDDNGTPNDDSDDFSVPAPPRSDQCRLTEHHKLTMNNFISLQDVFSSQVFDNISHYCEPDECIDADLPSTIFWRVRPVYQYSQATETGWAIGSGSGEIFGRWLEYDGTGVDLPHKFTLDPASTITSSAGTRCEDTENPTGNECLVQDNTYMQANSVVLNDSTSMQVPAFRWSAFPGNFSAWAGGYILQIARDPDFTTISMVESIAIPGIGTYGYGFQHSYALTTSLPDDSEGTGYWWRVVPCESDAPFMSLTLNNCTPLYYLASAGLQGDFADAAGAMSFTKDSSFITTVYSDFAGASPLIAWPEASGADHYEIEMASDPYFAEDLATLKTTVPRIVPYASSGTSGRNQEIADGTWYFRVRPIDKDGIEGGWSDTMYDPAAPNDPNQAIPAVFTKRTPAPTITTSDLTLEDVNPVVTWSGVAGADYYEVQWSTDSNFETYDSAQTEQTAYLLKGNNSTYFYRVRAVVDGNLGLWSSVDDTGPWAEALVDSRIEYEVSRTDVPAGQTVIVDGMVYLQGIATSNASVVLERKDTNCGVAGSYADYATATSGEVGEEGLVRFSFVTDRNRCFRMKWDTGSEVIYSAPIQITVQPIVTLSYSRTSVLRNANFYVTMRSNKVLYGRMRVQYRSGTTWYTIRTLTLAGESSQRARVAINRAGRFYTRVVLDRMYNPANGGDLAHLDYTDTYKYGAAVRVSDLWSYYY